MTPAPDRPLEARMSSTSSTRDGRITAERLGAVRPHPHSNRSSLLAGARAVSSMADIDAAEEENHPSDAERKQRSIAQDQLLRRLAGSRLDQCAVVGQPRQQ